MMFALYCISVYFVVLYCTSDHKSYFLTVSITKMKMANTCQVVWVKELASWGMGVV